MNLSTKFFLFLIILISSNFVFSQTRSTFLVGDIDGHVYNGDGLTIAGAAVGVDGWGQTTSNATGYYLLSGLPEGDNEVVCYKEGYNTVTEVVVVPSGGVVTHDFTLTQPNLTISPLFFDETLNPNEYFTTSLGILNTGDGDGGWTAVINYPSKGVNSNAINVTGQPYPDSKNTGIEKQEIAKNGGKPLDPSDATLELFECNPESLFGNSPVGSNNAYLSQYGGSYQQYQQVNGITESWTTITFWGVFTSGTPVTEDFFIGIYNDAGSTYGSEIASYILPLDPISTGEILLGTYPIYQWIALIDEQVATDFWISCQATSQMYWLQSPTGSGNSTATWPLAVCIEGDPTANWLTLDIYEDTVPANGGSQNIGVNFDATGTIAGEVYTAEIVITTDPDVGVFNIPVTMTVAGDPLCAVTDLEIEIINEVTGQYYMEWMFDTAQCSNILQYFLIQMDGVAVSTTTNTNGGGWLSPFGYGTYCFTVIPVFAEGHGVSATTCIDWYVPELCWSPATIYNEQWIDHQEEVNLTLESCGLGTLEFTFPDYGLGFIIDVEPATGIIPSGETMDITITYDATGFPVGLYDEWLKIETNDPLYEEDSIFNQMLVYAPGMFYGYVHDCNTGLPLLGVTVTTGLYSASTNDNGYYEMYVDSDTYDIEFSLLGYETMMVIDSYVSAGGMTEISICMSETPYPVPWVLAEPFPYGTGTYCLVTWGLPMGPYEIIYDDGEADDFVVWTEPGHMAGVKFTPVGYPATIIGGRFNVGDGSFPSGSNFMGSAMVILVMDDDGANGMPGTVLDSNTVYVSNYGWVDFYGLFDATIDDGGFFIVLLQPGYSFNSAPLAVDTDLPTVYRSYVKMVNGSWSISPYQDFMIRAYVDGPNAGVVSCSSAGKNVKIPKVTEGPFLANNLPNVKDGVVKDGEIRNIEEIDATRDLDYYIICRVINFDPELGPQTGQHIPITNPVNNYYTDIVFAAFEGFVAYAIKVIYDNGESDWTYSNIVAYGIDNEVTIVVALCNEGDLEDSEVTLVGLDYPYDAFQGVTDTNGIIVFDSVIDGSYDLFVSKVGYVNSFGNGFVILNDTTIGIELIQKMYPPTNLEVDSLTSVATWDEPLITQLYIEDFEDPAFPPQGWQATTLGYGWYRSDNSCPGCPWTIPPGDSFYAVSNDNENASAPSNCTEDYLITPIVDLRESEDFALHFSSFYDGAYGQSAYIEYSYDAGTNWELLETMSPEVDWVDVSVDLSTLSGPNTPSVWLAFHSDDNGNWGSGWAVDNVEVKNGPAPVLAYDVFLNNEFHAQTTPDETTYTFVDLIYGETYETCVFAIYDCGASDPICTTWESIYLQPPANLTDEYTYGTDEVLLMWNPPITGTNVPDGLTYFSLYRDSVNIADIPYEGQGVDDWITYVDNGLDPNPYEYYVSAVYDLDIFGYQGEFGESAWNGPDTVDVVWGNMIPFFEGWDNGTFSFQNWTFNENSENWAINSQQGEPEPSAEFTWDPLLENGYSSTLTSYPIIVDYLTEGDLFLSFDLQLENRNSTGDEKMLIEIYDGTTWHLAAEFSNSGKFSFTTNNINITEYTSGNAINIRFNATGQNSFDIISWFVDNINIYRECIPSTDLTGVFVWDNALQKFVAEVCWESPTISESLYLEGTNEAQLVVKNGSIREIGGFNIYRMEEDATIYELYDIVDYVEGQNSYCYSDADVIWYSGGYFYKVTTTYESSTDFCESAPALAYEIPTNDFVYVLYEDIEDLFTLTTNIYPNPAKDMLTVTSNIPMKQLIIIDYVGQTVYSSGINQATSIEVNTNSFKTGAYLVKIYTEKGVVTRRVIITR